MGWVAIWSAFERDPVSQRSGIRWRRRDRRLTRLDEYFQLAASGGPPGL